MSARTVLVLRTCKAEGTSSNGFTWPERGPVEAPDWRDDGECGHGLHGLLWGEGHAHYLDLDPGARWQVVRVKVSDVRDLKGKVKFPRGVVVHSGTRETATGYLAAHGGQGRAIAYGTATAGYLGTATAGYRGTAIAGAYGTATAGYRGTAIAGAYGTATAGDYGTATAGEYGTVVVQWFGGGLRYRLTVGYVGEDGILPNVAYQCDSKGRLVRADEVTA